MPCWLMKTWYTLIVYPIHKPKGRLMSRVKKPKKPMFPLVATVLFAIMFSTFPPAFVAIILDSTENRLSGIFHG